MHIQEQRKVLKILGNYYITKHLAVIGLYCGSLVPTVIITFKGKAKAKFGLIF